MGLLDVVTADEDAKKMLTLVPPAFVVGAAAVGRARRDSGGKKAAGAAEERGKALLWRGSPMDEATKEPHPCMAVVSHPHCQKLLDEFFAQGDAEKSEGLPVSAMCDREKVPKPDSQIGFINAVISPTWQLFLKIFPESSPLAIEIRNNIKHNLEYWIAQKEERKAGHTFYAQGRYFSRQRGFQCASTTKILTTLNSRKK